MKGTILLIGSRIRGRLDLNDAVLSNPRGLSLLKSDGATIDGDVEDLRPGMTAVAEIHVEYLRDVIAIPVQAIVQVERETWCYVRRDGVVERTLVELGGTNDKFVEIKNGLVEGDQVILNPMAIVEEEKADADDLAFADSQVRVRQRGRRRPGVRVADAG